MPGRWWSKSIAALGVFILFFVGHTICTTSLHAFQESDVISPRNSDHRVAAAAGPDSAAVNSKTAVTGSKPWVVILCRYADWKDYTPFSKEEAEKIMGSVHPGMDHYWREVSYGKINLEGSVVVGWYDLPHPRDYYVRDGNGDGLVDADTQRIVDDATNAADGDVYFPDFAGIIFVMTDTGGPSACGGEWEIDKDGVRRPYGCVWIPSLVFEVCTLAHEMGHGFGMRHSSGPYGRLYDSAWDVMSDPADYRQPSPHFPMHPIAYHKDSVGWIDPGRKLVVTPGTSQTIFIERLAQPISSTDYLLVVIPIPGTERFYTLEARKFAGYDSTLFGEGVIIHEVDLSRDPPPHVVDIDNNGDVNDEGARWNPGEVFTDDAHGITVSVNAETYSGFEVTVAVDSYPDGVTDRPTAAAATGVTVTGFTANWTAPSGTATTTGYLLDVSPDPGFGYFISGYNDLPVSSTSAAVVGLSSNRTYYYRMRAINVGGTSSNSNTVSVTTIADAPTATAATAIIPGSFTANWTAPSGTAAITGYRLDVSTDPGFASFVTGYNNLPVSGTSAAVMGLASNWTYYYRTRAINAGGTSSNSNTVSVTTIANAPTATAATAITPGSFTANWTAPSGTAAITGYRLDVSTDPGFASFVTGYNDLPVSGTSEVVTGLFSNEKYYYRTRAINAGETSSNSNTVSVTTIADAPTATAATAITQNSFTANWMPPSGTATITGYRLDVATDAGFTSFVTGYANLSVSGTSATVTGLSASGSYFYRVRAVNAGGTSSNSNAITSVIPAPPLMTITSPGEGTSWKAGSKQIITWTYNGTPGSKVKIELLKTGSVSGKPIAASASAGKGGSGSYSWTLPAALKGSDYQIRVTSTTNSNYTATSSNFTIEGPTISVNPVGDTVAGGKYPISWTYTGSPGNVKIELVSGGTSTVIKPSVSAGKNGAGSYAWTVPKAQPTGGNYTIKVSALASSDCSGTSSPFKITGPTITVSRPTSGESFTAGGKLPITWNYTGSPGNVKIELMQDSTAVKTIKASTSAGKNNSGAYSWKIPKTQAAGDYLVRITAVANSSCGDTSDVFSIGALKASAGPDQHAKASALVNLSGRNSTGITETSAAYHWAQTLGPPVEISDPNAPETIFLAPEINTGAVSLGFQLTVTNSEGVKSEDSCIINVSDTRTPPVAEAGQNREVSVAQIVELDGSKSAASASNPIVSYSWKQISGMPVILTDPSAVQTTFIAPGVSTSGQSLVFELTVTDQTGLRARDICVVSIISQNRPPIADAGPSQTVSPGAGVVLNGTRSYDEDGAIMFYRWKQLSGKPVTLSDPMAATPSFEAPLSESGCEEYTLVFQLIVTDSMGLEAGSKTTIHVATGSSGSK